MPVPLSLGVAAPPPQPPPLPPPSNGANSQVANGYGYSTLVKTRVDLAAPASTTAMMNKLDELMAANEAPTRLAASVDTTS